jgi:hypothetical protein
MVLVSSLGGLCKVLTKKTRIIREELGKYRQDPIAFPHDRLHKGCDPLKQRQSAIGMGLVFEMREGLDIDIGGITCHPEPQNTPMWDRYRQLLRP